MNPLNRVAVFAHAWTVACIMLLSFAGCVRTIHPVLTDEQVMLLDGLEGAWTTEDGESSAEVTFDAEAREYRIAYRDSDGKPGTFLARVGKVGELTVAEFRPADPAPAASDVYRIHVVPLYSFALLEQRASAVTIRPMSQQWLKDYLEKNPGELQVIERARDELIVTSPTPDVQAFLLKHWKDDGALTDPVVFVRAKPAEAPATRPAP